MARQDFGWRHEPCLCSGLYSVQHGHKRDDSFAAANIALEQPQHPLVRAHIGEDLSNRLVLAAGKGKGQGGEGLPAQLSVTCQYAAGQLALLLANQGYGDLIGQELVIGQTPARGGAWRKVCFGLRGMGSRQSGFP